MTILYYPRCQERTESQRPAQQAAVQQAPQEGQQMEQQLEQQLEQAPQPPHLIDELLLGNAMTVLGAGVVLYLVLQLIDVKKELKRIRELEIAVAELRGSLR